MKMATKQPFKTPPTVPRTTITRNQSAQALTYILNLLGHDSDSPLAKSLTEDGITNIQDFIAMEKEHIEDLTYIKEIKDENGNVIEQLSSVPRGHRAHIKIFPRICSLPSRYQQAPTA